MILALAGECLAVSDTLDHVCQAANKGNVAELKASLAQAPQCINLFDDGGWTPLMHASASNRPEAIAVLVQSGSDVNLAMIGPAGRGRTPLMIASSAGAFEAVSALLAAHAFCNKVDSEERTALIYAAREGGPDCGECIRLLLSAGADPDISDREGFTPLIWSATLGDEVALAHFIAAKADVEIASKTKDTALLAAARWGNAPCVAHLLKAGADSSVKDGKGLTAVQVAAACGSATCIKPLADGKADLEAADADGKTALCLAAAEGHVDCIVALASAGRVWM